MSSMKCIKNKVFIIAEIGVNHNGNLKLAKKSILEAKNSGADAVKFQSFKADALATKFTPKSDIKKEVELTKLIIKC